MSVSGRADSERRMWARAPRGEQAWEYLMNYKETQILLTGDSDTFFRTSLGVARTLKMTRSA